MVPGRDGGRDQGSDVPAAPGPWLPRFTSLCPSLLSPKGWSACSPASPWVFLAPGLSLLQAFNSAPGPLGGVLGVSFASTRRCIDPVYVEPPTATPAHRSPGVSRKGRNISHGDLSCSGGRQRRPSSGKRGPAPLPGPVSRARLPEGLGRGEPGAGPVGAAVPASRWLRAVEGHADRRAGGCVFPGAWGPPVSQVPALHCRGHWRLTRATRSGGNAWGL